VEPRLESVRIPEPGQLLPGDHQRLLHGVLGPIDVAQDPVGNRVEAVGVNPDQDAEGLPVTVLRLLHEVAIHRPSDGTQPGGAFRQYRAEDGVRRSIARPDATAEFGSSAFDGHSASSRSRRRGASRGQSGNSTVSRIAWNVALSDASDPGGEDQSNTYPHPSWTTSASIT
jgi:hypothetical protein